MVVTVQIEGPERLSWAAHAEGERWSLNGFASDVRDVTRQLGEFLAQHYGPDLRGPYRE